MKLDGAKGSLAASRDPDIRAAIKKGSKQQDDDARSMETWARGGFSSGLEVAFESSFVDLLEEV